MHALRQLVDWPVDRFAVGVLRFDPSGGRDGPVDVVGVSGDTAHRFPWASVTKPATALAVLVAVEEGTLSLDEEAGPPGSTVRHLLAHASGLGPEAGPVLAAPGRRRIYSNAGFGVLADLLADRAGVPFSRYLSEGVLDPLGMHSTTLDAETPGGAAAAGLQGSLADLVALASEWAAPTLIAPDTHRAAFSVQYAGLAGVLPGFQRFDPCDWGLGVEIRGGKQPHWTGAANHPATFGHFGRSGSFFWVDPVAGVACAGLADRPFGPWAARAWPALADSVLAEVARARPTG
jgi:CubicO group peptidase (beta-lactamase class C family)